MHCSLLKYEDIEKLGAYIKLFGYAGFQFSSALQTQHKVSETGLFFLEFYKIKTWAELFSRKCLLYVITRSDHICLGKRKNCGKC